MQTPTKFQTEKFLKYLAKIRVQWKQRDKEFRSGNDLPDKHESPNLDEEFEFL